MSDSSNDLLFGDLTDADNSDCLSPNVLNGTSYPQHPTCIAGDSDSSESSSETYSPHPSQSDDKIHSKRNSHSVSRLKKKKSRRASLHKLMSTTATEFSAGERDVNEDVHAAASHVTSTRKSGKTDKRKRFLNGRSQPNHHALSRDSSDDELYEVDLATISSPDSNSKPMKPSSPQNSIYTSCIPLNVLKTLHHNGHSISVFLTLTILIAAVIVIVGTFYNPSTISIIVLVALYALYLLECTLNKTWTEVSAKRKHTTNTTVNLLDTLRNTPPVIDWSVECYHFETTQLSPTSIKKMVIWVNGKPEEAAKLNEFGLDIKCFQHDWDAIDFVAERSNQSQIAAIIVPPGYEGTRIQRVMVEKWSSSEDKVTIIIDDDYSENSGDFDSEHARTKDSKDSEETRSLSEQSLDTQCPIFVSFDGDNIEELKTQLVAQKVVTAQRKKVITHSESSVYNYNSWRDVSADYPSFEQYVMTSLAVDKHYSFANDATERDYAEKKKLFLAKNDRDEFQSFTETVEILGFNPDLVIRNSDRASGEMDALPFWCTTWGYWVCSLLLCSVYPRYKCATRCTTEDWRIVKSISV